MLTIISLLSVLNPHTREVSPMPKEKLLSKHEISLNKRYNNTFVSDVFKDNMLLNIAYMADKVHSSADIKWDDIEKPFHYEVILNPNQTFAFHDDIRPELKNQVVKTTNAHFDSEEGFKSDGYLYGDGVCHLASLINWAAKDAALDVLAPTNHNFATIPEIPREFGTSIYNQKGASGLGKDQNLYITNKRDKPVVITFDHRKVPHDDRLAISVVERE